MTQQINRILKPGKAILILYGVFSFVFLLVYVWRVSFVWDYFFGPNAYIYVLMAAIIAGLLFALYFDQKKGWRLKRYFILSLLQLVLVWILAHPVRTWQINRSMERAKSITESLEAYKQKFGQYPVTLQELGEKLDKELPKRTCLGTRYFYQQHGQNDYRLKFMSYYGNTAYYNNEENTWLVTD